MKVEQRTYPIEFRKGSGAQMSGYAAVFNSPSEDIGFVERIQPGAFKNALKKSDVRALFNHDPNFVLGRSTAGTLRLMEDEKGLRVEIDPPKTTWAADLRESIRRNDINQMSFSFTVAPGGDVWNRDYSERTIIEVDQLMDISAVVFPAYSATQIESRHSGVTHMEQNQEVNQAETRGVVGPTYRTPVGGSSGIQVGETLETTKPWGTFGQQLRAIAVAGSPSRIVDPRLLPEFRAASGLSEGIQSDGGFLVQTDFSNKILETVWETGSVTSRVNRIQVSGNANGLKMNGLDETSRADGSRAGGIQSYWAAEAAEFTASKPKFRQIELKLWKHIGLCYATDELLDDAVALEKVITSGFQKEFDFKITDCIINGDGVGKPLGIMNAGCLVTASAEVGQAANTFIYENALAMWPRLMPSSRPNAVWLINCDLEPELYKMSLAVGTGGAPVYMPGGGASSTPFSSLFGRPVLPVEQCQTLGTVGDIILADLSQYLFIDKGSVKRDVSIHVRFVYDESCFRFVYRCDGQPVLGSAITPKNGTNTLSHFVALATR